MNSRRDTLLQLAGGLVLALVAFALRAHDIGRYGLWYDEIFSAEIARMPSLALIERTANDVHPPLYYLLLRAWNLLTGSEVDGTMRLVSAVLDVAGIGATALVAWVVFKRRWVAWFAAVLHATSPYAILYAQELRMYSLLLLTSSLSTAAMFKLKEERHRGWLALYVGATLCALYTHMFAVFLVVAQTAWFSVASRQRTGISRGRWFGLSVALAVAYSPWAWVITRQMLWARGFRDRDDWWIPRPPLKALIGVLHVFLGADWFALAVGGVLLALTAWLLVRWQGEPLLRDQLFGAALVVALPIAGVFVLSYLTTPVFVARFFTEVVPSFWLLLVAPVVLLPRPWMKGLAGAALLVTGLLAVPRTNYEHSFKAPTPYREVVAELAKASPPLVLVDDTGSTQFAWRWYAGLLGGEVPASVAQPMVFKHDEPIAPLPEGTGEVTLLWVSSKPAPEQLAQVGGGVLPLVSSEARGTFQLRRYARPAR